MYELVKISDCCYYIDCPVKISIYTAGGENVWLIDSGNDKSAGKKVKQILEKNNWRLSGILNTHSHADHIGGNRYLQGQTGCRIYAGGVETAFTEYPVLEPSFLYGGYPCKDLRHKFLLAQESCVSDFSEEGFPKEIEVIPLPGHSFDMVGFRIPDQTVFLADCLSSRATLEKYAVPFIYDVGAYLDTLDMVEDMEAAVFVPSHAEVSPDIRELVRFNREKVHEIAEKVLSVCEEPLNFETVLQKIFQGYGLAMNFEQYALVGSTIKSFLAWLRDREELDVVFEDQKMMWKRKR